MLKNTILTLLFWVGLAALPGCFRCDCEDPKPFVDINGLYSIAVKKSASSSTPVAVKAGDKISWDDLVFLSATYQVRYYAGQLPAESASPPWGSVAYACKCSEEYGYLGTQEKLKFMTIRTVHDFDVTHPANSVINELIAFITYPKPARTSLTDYFLKGPIPYNTSGFQFLVTQAPANKGPFALEITVELDNGETYTARTPLIELI